MHEELTARLTYSIGNEHNPVDPFGRSHLVVEPDGGAQLDHYGRLGQHRAWTGRVEPAALQRLWSALQRAGFPSVADHHPLPPDAAICRLTAEAGDVRQIADVPWHAARGLPGYDEAVAILESIVRQLSEDTVGRPITAAQVAVVGDIRRVS